MGLVTLSPRSRRHRPLFFAHLFLVSALLAYFPFSKLMHGAGVFLSPTRNWRTTAARAATSTPGTPGEGPHLRGVGGRVPGQDRAAGLPLEKA